MTDLVVERLRITCRSGRGERHDALATRRRLESIARTRLPRLLEQRAADWDHDVRLDDLTVRLDFDPRVHDDDTVAVRWAALIAVAIEVEAEAEAVRRRLSGTLADATAQGADPAAASHPTAVVGRTETTGGPSQTGAPLTRTRIHLLLARALAGDQPAAAELVAAVLSPQRRTTILSALDRGGLDAVLEMLASASERATEEVAEDRSDPALRSRPRAPTDAPSEVDAVAPAGGDEIALAADAVRAAAAALAQHSSGDHETSADLAQDDRFATACGGLVIAYPWLVSFLEEAVGARPDLDPIGVRRQALAAVAGHQYLADDPLVRLLAGDDLSSPPSVLAAPEDGEELERSAADLLTSFAGAIAGFEASPPDYVRREFILRPGTVDLAASPVAVELPPAPLDPALALLPYPLGLFALPWTPTLVIRLERG